MDMDDQSVLLLKDKMQNVHQRLATAPKDKQALEALKQALDSLAQELEACLPGPQDGR